MRRDPNLRTGAFPLDTVERWLQAVVVHPGDITEALRSEEAAREVHPCRVGDLVRPSRSLTPEERVDIYHEMYLLRMEEALASDYPAVRHFLGEEGFQELVRDYVQRYPSRSYTLNRLGDDMPRFLLEEPRRQQAVFLHDLARAELAISQVFDAEESPVLAPSVVQSVPPEAWPLATLRTVRAFRLLELQHPVMEHLEALRRDEPVPRFRKRASWLVVWRREYTVYRMELARAEHALLRALADGHPLGRAVAESAASMKSSQAQKKIFKWFRNWVAEGMFSAVDCARNP